jgi:LPXTG-motif cell wall-anchored protein
MTDIHDILPPVPVGIDAPWLIAALIALAAAALLAAAWWLWRKRKKARFIETIIPELPPEMTAMRALDGISDVRRLDAKTFYFRLSAILRQYVFGRLPWAHRR